MEPGSGITETSLPSVPLAEKKNRTHERGSSLQRSGGKAGGHGHTLTSMDLELFAAELSRRPTSCTENHGPLPQGCSPG